MVPARLCEGNDEGKESVVRTEQSSKEKRIGRLVGAAGNSGELIE